MKLEIRKLSKNDGKEIYDFLQEIDPIENDFTNEVYGMPYEVFQKWILKQVDWSEGINLPQNYVPQTTYWLYADNVPVGYGKIRHGLTEYSRQNGGNIGYAISRKQRGRGYGTYLMSELIKIAKDQGITERLATVTKNNIASKTVIEKCGGKIIKENEHFWYFQL